MFCVKINMTMYYIIKMLCAGWLRIFLDIFSKVSCVINYLLCRKYYLNGANVETI